MELFGASLTLFEENDALLKGLNEGYRAAWMTRHGNPENQAVIRAGLAGLWLLQQAGYVGELCYDAHGRPRLKDGAVDFNISHTENYVFCAIAKGEGCIGVDAEEPKRMSSLRSLALAERWFVGGERRDFARDPSLNRFLEIWTRKEAFLKRTGDGLRAIKSTDVTDVEAAHNVRFYDFSTADAIVTLCCDASAEPPTELVWVTASR